MIKGTFNVTETLARWVKALPLKKQQNMANYIYKASLHYISQYATGRKENIPGLVLGIYQAMDEIHEQSKNVMKKNISCKKGCSFCCHINVNITSDEAKVITTCCKDAGITIDYAYLQEQAKDPPMQQALGKHSACVFLKNGECTIYPFRPMNCRKYFVCSPPLQCDVKRKMSNTVDVFFELETEIIHSAIVSTLPIGSMATMLLKNQTAAAHP